MEIRCIGHDEKGEFIERNFPDTDIAMGYLLKYLSGNVIEKIYEGVQIINRNTELIIKVVPVYPSKDKVKWLHDYFTLYFMEEQ